MTQRILFSVKDGTKRGDQIEGDGENLTSVEQKDSFKEDPLSEIEGTWLNLYIRNYRIETLHVDDSHFFLNL